MTMEIDFKTKSRKAKERELYVLIRLIQGEGR